jgi:DNA-binding NarL/FixJ family response regulator
MNVPYCVLVADAHPVFRAGLRGLLASLADFLLVAEASTSHETLSLAAELKPAVVVLDVAFVKDADVIRAITGQGVHVLVLSELEDDAILFAALRSGARGYLYKSASHDEIKRALYAVAHGEAIFSAAIAERLPKFFAGLAALSSSKVLQQLTTREREVLHLLSYRMTNKEIARRLELRPKTVRNHVSSIVGKLQVTNRIEAGLRAREEGLN